MKYSKFLILSVIFFYTLTSKSQTIDPEAKKIFETINKQYETSNSFYIKFEYELKNAQEKINEKQIGSIFASKEKYNLKIMKINQIYDGAKLYTVDDEEKEITVSTTNKNGGDVLNPTQIFNSYSNGFNITKAGTQKIKGKNCNLYKLIPTTNSKSQAKEIIIAIDKAKNELVQLKDTNKNGTITIITLIEHTKNGLIPATLFTFNKKSYNGYVITEL